jgi:hypothetical protein
MKPNKIKFEMDMPSNCYECPMCYETEGISYDSCQLYYYLRNENDNFKAKICDFRQNTPDWCPLLRFEKVEE